jgi:hypothetical protein
LEKEKEISSQKFYDPAGLPVQNPESGVFIRKSIYKNGTVDIRKIFAP